MGGTDTIFHITFRLSELFYDDTDMVPTVKLPDYYFQYQTNFLRFLGIEVLIENESLRYRIYSYCTLVFTLIYIFVECIEAFFHKDFDTMVVCCNYSISHFLGMIKIIVFYQNRKKIGKLLKSMNEGVYTPDDLRDGNFERRTLHRFLRESYVLSVAYGWTIIIVILLGTSQGAYKMFFRPQEEWRLSFLPISIVNTTYSPRFEIAYVYQFIGILYISLYVWTSDVTVISVIAIIAAHLIIFERALRDFEARAARKLHLSNLTLKQSVTKELEDAVEHHLRILEDVETIETLCSYLVLCVFIANLVLLCLLMYYTSVMPVQSLDFAQYLVYCVLIATQVFLYCWFGNELTLANERLAVAAAQTYNPDGPIDHAKALKLVIIRAQRPLFLTAGKFAPLSLDTYKGIIKGSFSYFMVLRQVNE